MSKLTFETVDRLKPHGSGWTADELELRCEGAHAVRVRLPDSSAALFSLDVQVDPGTGQLLEDTWFSVLVDDSGMFLSAHIIVPVHVRADWAGYAAGTWWAERQERLLTELEAAQEGGGDPRACGVALAAHGLPADQRAAARQLADSFTGTAAEFLTTWQAVRATPASP